MPEPKTVIIAPARLASTRFPEKLLHRIKGKPLVLWVAERLAEQAPEFERYFAVDDRRIGDVLEAEGHAVVMTRVDHASGTDRLAEANAAIGADVVINVQGDEPCVSREQILDLAALMTDGVAMATMATPFKTRRDFLDPNQVKVTLANDGKALYFSRATIPYNRDGFDTFDDAWVAKAGVYRHLGLYAYRADFLRAFCTLPEGKLESIERLEQLRALENGYTIKVGFTGQPSIGIDRREDADAFERWLDGQR